MFCWAWFQPVVWAWIFEESPSPAASSPARVIRRPEPSLAAAEAKRDCPTDSQRALVIVSAVLSNRITIVRVRTAKPTDGALEAPYRCFFSSIGLTRC